MKIPPSRAVRTKFVASLANWTRKCQGVGSSAGAVGLAGAENEERQQALQAQRLIEQADAYLSACVRAALGGEAAPAWPAAWDDGAVHQLLAARIGFHGIAVLLGEMPGALADWPQPVADAVREEMRLAALWEATHRAQLVPLLERMAAANIPAMVMKGTAVAYLFYAQPAARRRGDSDLLIHPADLESTRALLEDCGFQRRDDPWGLHFQETWEVACRSGIVHAVDLHWQPADRPVLQGPLRAEWFWQDKVPVTGLAPGVHAPDPVMMLVHGAVNQAWHRARGFNVEGDTVLGGRRLIWAVDYARIAARLSPSDWLRLARFCEDHDAAAIVMAALAGAQRDLGLRIPPDIAERLARASDDSPTLAYINEPGVFREFLRDFAAAQDMATRWLLIRMLAFAPRSHLLRKYPERAHWPTLLLQLCRYLDFLRRRGRWSVGP